MKQTKITSCWQKKELKNANPERAKMLLDKAVAKVKRQWMEYKYLADRPF